MNSLLKYVLKKAGLEQVGVFYGWSRASGWRKSLFSKTPVDARGEALPWYCYPFIHFLNGRLGNQVAEKPRVFEFGSGNSTVWWSKRAIEVVSIEDHREWYAKIKEQQPDNVLYNFATDESGYVDFINTQVGLFHVIVVDGSHREKCIDVAVSKLTEDGVLIIDNSELESLSAAVAGLIDRGFRQLEFFGLGPVNGHPWGTSVFYRDGNLFGI